MSWETETNFVADGGKSVDQTVKLTLENDEEVVIPTVDMSRVMDRTSPIPAKKITDRFNRIVQFRFDEK
jgi:hypothetical protein